jgi:hypothetical protein
MAVNDNLIIVTKVIIAYLKELYGEPSRETKRKYEELRVSGRGLPEY